MIRVAQRQGCRLARIFMAATLLLASGIGLFVSVPLSVSVPSIVSAQDTEVPVEPPPTDVPPVEMPPTDTPIVELPPTDTPAVEVPTNTPTIETPTDTPTVTPTNTATSTSANRPLDATPTTGSTSAGDGAAVGARAPSTRASSRTNGPTDRDDPDYYLGRIDAWLTSEISGGDTLRTDMTDPQFDDAEWYVTQISAVGLILSIDAELQGLDQPNPDLDDVHQQVLSASSDLAAAASDCDAALVLNDVGDAASCQAAIEISTRTVHDLRDALAEWDGSEGNLVASTGSQPQRSTIEPTVEPTATPEREPRGGASTTAARPTATMTDDVTTDSEVVAETGNGETRDSPLRIGETGVVGDYEITVLSVQPNATDLVAAENEFNDPPAAGDQFFIARLSVTYRGSGTGNPSFDLNYQSVGESSTSYTTFTNSCGVVPDDPSLTVTDLFAGGTAEFNVCWAIDSDDANSVEMYVQSLFDFNSDPVWFSLNESTRR